MYLFSLASSTLSNLLRIISKDSAKEKYAFFALMIFVLYSEIGIYEEEGFQGQVFKL